MSGVGSFFDEYSLKARVWPAAIVASPALTLLAFTPKASVTALVSGAVFLAMTMLAVQLILHSGHRTEARLVAAWGGMPTTKMLRTSNSDAPRLVAERRRHVERATGLTLPTAEDERASPTHADQEYAHAVGRCIDLVRDERSSRLLKVENIAYGFRRNLRSARAAGIIVALMAFVAGVGLGIFLHAPTPGVVAGTYSLVLLIVWVFAIRDNLVRDQSEKYAQSFFRTVEAHNAIADGANSLPPANGG